MDGYSEAGHPPVFHVRFPSFELLGSIPHSEWLVLWWWREGKRRRRVEIGCCGQLSRVSFYISYKFQHVELMENRKQVFLDGSLDSV